MNTIPLHQLPDKAILCVLQRMETYDQLAYSFCSKKTKKSIKSLKLKAQQINFNVDDSIEVEIRVQNLSIIWNSMKHNSYFPNNQIIVHDGILFTSTGGTGTKTGSTWDFEDLGFKEWLQHYCEVLHRPRIDTFDFSGENIKDSYIKPIQKVIKGLQIGCLSLFEDLTNDFAKKVLESFPNYEELFLDHTPFDSYKLDKVLVQNLKSVCILDAEQIKIDQVLLINSEKLQLKISNFNEKDLNRLLKLWIRGSNPRLKYFFTWGELQLENDSLDMNLIMKGIKHNQVPLDSEEVYGDYINGDYYKETKLAGGSRIRRFNGTTAVIVVTGNHFEFIVE